MALPNSDASTDPTIASKLTDLVDQSNSPLLGLPRELRDIICEMVFEGCSLDISCGCADCHSETTPQSVGILLACKQIHVEAISIYYSEVTPIFSDEDVLVEWAQHLPITYLQQIRTIKCELYAKTRQIAAALHGSPVEQMQREVCELVSYLHDSGVSLRDGQLSVVFTSVDGKWYVSCHLVRHRAYI